MSAPSITVSQTDFCDAVSHVNITSEPTSGYDTPIPRARISDDTIQTLNTVSTWLEGLVSKNSNPRKRPRNGSPDRRDPKEPYIDTRGQYPKELKQCHILDYFVALIHLTYQTIAIARRQPVPPNERKDVLGFTPGRTGTLHSTRQVA